MNRFVIKKACGIYLLKMNDILYMEKDLRRIKVYLADSCRSEEMLAAQNGCIEFYGKFTDVMKFLDHRFMHCHRSYVINKDKVVVLGDNKVYLESNKCICMGRDTFHRVEKEMEKYSRRKHVRVQERQKICVKTPKKTLSFMKHKICVKMSKKIVIP